MKFIIVTPSYNQRQFIAQTITSVASQRGSVQHWVIDGNSSDGTIALLKKQSHPQFHWLSERDQGQSDALNKGLKKAGVFSLTRAQAQQTIVAYLNSDDYYLPNAFEEVEQLFKKNPRKNWLIGDCLIVDGQGHPIQKWVRLYKLLWRWLLCWPVLLVLNPIPQPAVFIRATALQAVGPFSTNLSYVMDYEYWLRLWQYSGRPLISQLTLAAFRIHKSSKGGSQYRTQFREECEVAQQFTSSRILRSLHTLHSKLILTVYDLVKG